MQKLILSLLLLLLYSHAMADEIVTLENGKTAILKDNGTWSYIRSPESTTTGLYQDISLIDLKSDINSLDGKKIKIQALAEMYNFILMLKQEDLDETPLSVNINGLSKEDRIRLRTECNNGCTIAVYGRVGDVMYDEKGIIADKIAW